METETKICPYCFEEIKVEATKCRWCRSNLESKIDVSNWYRDVAGRRFLGVASLLSMNTRLPVIFWRLLFIVTTFIHGIGIIAYVTLWLLTPFYHGGRAPLERIVHAFQESYDTIRKDELGGNEAGS